MRKPPRWLLVSGVSLGIAGASTVALVGPRLSSRASGQTTLQKTSDAFQSAVSRAVPAVVSIQANRLGPIGVGSGVLVRPEGVILTNYHVVEDARSVTVTLNNERKLKAEVLGSDPLTDLAVIRLKETGRERFPTIHFADSDHVQVGDWALAVGSPFGLQHSVTSGIVSAKGRGQMGVYDIEDFIQTDAAINPGNSGGPLLNLDGEMIGLNAAIFSQTGGFIGIGFSISANLARTVADDLIRYGHVRRGWIGAGAQDLDPALARHFDVKDGKGALITSVEPSGPAQQAELRPEDVVVEFNGQPVRASGELQKLVIRSHAGQRIPFEVIRDGQHRRMSLVIREQPRVLADSAVNPHQMAGQAVRDAGDTPPEKAGDGLLVRDLTPEFRDLLGARAPESGALVVAVQPGSHAFSAGMAPGDIILKANKEEIHSARQFNRLNERISSKDQLVLYIQRGPAKRAFIGINPAEP